MIIHRAVQVKASAFLRFPLLLVEQARVRLPTGWSAASSPHFSRLLLLHPGQQTQSSCTTNTPLLPAPSPSLSSLTHHSSIFYLCSAQLKSVRTKLIPYRSLFYSDPLTPPKRSPIFFPRKAPQNSFLLSPLAWKNSWREHGCCVNQLLIISVYRCHHPFNGSRRSSARGGASDSPFVR